MSTNLHIVGTREVTVNKTGEQSIQIANFDLWQTPTKVTRSILGSEDKLQAYIDWINNDNRCVREEPIYHENDIFEEGEIIGYKSVCYSDIHIAKLKEFITVSEAKGYEIEFYSL
jgi:hypothetical protein